MKTFHVVTIVLNAYLGPTASKLIHGSHDGAGRPRASYVQARGKILSQLTLKSLAHQTTQDFHIVVLHDHRLDVRQYVPVPHVADHRLHFVGIEPIDFKNNVAGAFWLPRGPEDEKIYELAGDAERLLITHIDSDDCYRYDALERFAQEARDPGCLMVRNGFIHQVSTGAVGRYHAASPPFYTLVYDLESYRSGTRWVGGPGHHTKVAALIPTRYIDDPLYMVNIHGANDSTRWRVAHGKGLSAHEAGEVRSQFGILDDADLLA